MSIAIDRDKCLACGVCEEYCVLDNIRVQVPPCRAACPININPQAYCTLLAMDRPDDALEMIYKDAPFPRLLGYVCHAPCERECNRRLVDEPVSIKELKRFLVDRAAHPAAPVNVGWPTGKRVAIVGAGPAGMMAAVSLRQMGHEVTMYDSLPEAGGMTLVGIPRFHLPEAARKADTALLDTLDVEQNYGTTVGRDIGFVDLREGYDAVLLAVGTHVEERLNIEGEQAPGVLDGLSLLRAVNSGKEIEVGQRVLVIGGGNVAIDSARTALRLGAQDAQIVCLEKRDEMPAFPVEVREAVEEGITLNCTWGPERIILEKGSLKGLECMRCTSVWGPGGGFLPTFDPDQRLTLSADTLIVSIGQSPDVAFLADSDARDILKGNPLWVNPATMETRLKGVFAAGDMVTGPSSVVEAMSSGRKAAVSIDRYVRGQDVTSEQIRKEQKLLTGELDLARARRYPRAVMPQIDITRRKNSFEVIHTGYDAATARQEADRCLRCAKAIEYYNECWYCLPCEIECPTEALRLEIPFLVS
jgi:NADPH-dependent glutamate synthase beta subunit-like oxidoreductase